MRDNADNVNRDSIVSRIVNINAADQGNGLDRLVVPFVDSERGGQSIKELMEFAREWDKPHAELA